MPDHNIVTRLLETPGFGWQCGEPLQDKGSYFRCSCGCSQPDADLDGYLMILQPKILREAAQEIERLRAERDEARRQYCRGFTDFCPNPAHDELTLEEAAMEVAKSFGWACFEGATHEK